MPDATLANPISEGGLLPVVARQPEERQRIGCGQGSGLPFSVCLGSAQLTPEARRHVTGSARHDPLQECFGRLPGEQGEGERRDGRRPTHSGPAARQRRHAQCEQGRQGADGQREQVGGVLGPVIQREAKIDQLPWGSQRRLRRCALDDGSDSKLQEPPVVAAVAGVTNPQGVIRDLVHEPRS